MIRVLDGLATSRARAHVDGVAKGEILPDVDRLGECSLAFEHDGVGEISRRGYRRDGACSLSACALVWLPTTTANTQVAKGAKAIIT